MISSFYYSYILHIDDAFGMHLGMRFISQLELKESRCFTAEVDFLRHYNSTWRGTASAIYKCLGHCGCGFRPLSLLRVLFQGSFKDDLRPQLLVH